MEIMYLLIPLSVILVFLIGGLFWWSLRSGQFDDMEGPGYRILMDDDRVDGVDSVDRAERPVSAQRGEHQGARQDGE